MNEPGRSHPDLNHWSVMSLRELAGISLLTDCVCLTPSSQLEASMGSYEIRLSIMPFMYQVHIVVGCIRDRVIYIRCIRYQKYRLHGRCLDISFSTRVTCSLSSKDVVTLSP